MEDVTVMESDNQESYAPDVQDNGLDGNAVRILIGVQTIYAMAGLIFGGMIFFGNIAYGIMGWFGAVTPPEYLGMWSLQGLIILVLSVILLRASDGLLEQLPEAFSGTLYMSLISIVVFATIGVVGLPFILISIIQIVFLFLPGVKVFWLSEYIEDMKPRAKETRFTLHLVRKSPLVVAGIIIIVFMVSVALFAPWIATYEAEDMPFGDMRLPPGSASLSLNNINDYLLEDTELEIALLPDFYYNEFTVSESHLETTELPRLFFGVSSIDVGLDSVHVNSSTDINITASFYELNLSTYESLSESQRESYLVRRINSTTGTLLQYITLPDNTATYVWELQISAAYKTNTWTANTRVVLNYRTFYPDHIWGTDNYGGDIYSRIVWGAQEDLRIALSVVFVALSIGAIIGAASGYYGGKLDELVMRITDIFFAFPGLILAMAIVMALGERNLQNISIALMITWWPTYARLVRGQVLAEREKLYIEAARSVGASDSRILFFHILPNTIQPVIVQATMDIGSVLLVAAGLAYIGFGPPVGTAEWGLMIANGQDHLLGAPWMTLYPGLAILVTALAFNLVGDGVRDIMDPKLRRR